MLFLMKISALGIGSSLLGYSKYNIRLLSVLISLEGLMLSLLVFFYSALSFSGTSMHFFLVLLTLAACEAALGLSLLVSILRLRSNDYIPLMSSLNF